MRKEWPFVKWVRLGPGLDLHPNRSGPEEREHREHPAMVVRRGGEVELGEDVSNVALDRLGRYEHPLGYGLVRPALGHERQDLAVPVRTGSRWGWPCGPCPPGATRPRDR